MFFRFELTCGVTVGYEVYFWQCIEYFVFFEKKCFKFFQILTVYLKIAKIFLSAKLCEKKLDSIYHLKNILSVYRQFEKKSLNVYEVFKNS